MRPVALIAGLLLASLASNAPADDPRDQLRRSLRTMLGIPTDRCDLAPEFRGSFERDGIVIEKWIFTAEPGSRVPALFYRPAEPPRPMPAIVLTYGHGSSKSAWQYNYAAQLYARLGLAVLAIDPIGEEERNRTSRMASRAHDPEPVHRRAQAAGRLIMGKLVFDTMRGVDFLLTRSDIDPQRIGVAGNSLGGAVAGWMATLDDRLSLAIISGWAFDDIAIRTKLCTSVPNQHMRNIATWGQFAALAAPRCAVLFLNGDADVVIDRDGDHSAWRGTNQAVAEAATVYQTLGAPGRIATWYLPGAGHRPYHLSHAALNWIHHHLGTPAMTATQLQALPTINGGEWGDANGIIFERLYGTDLHQRGADLVDIGLKLIPRHDLAVLTDDEQGSPLFTLEGWLDLIEQQAAASSPGR